jgi:hypothetical protein
MPSPSVRSFHFLERECFPLTFLLLMHRKFSKTVTSVRNAVASAVMGNEDFSIADLLSSEYDLKYAAKHFKFALVPKVSSELVAMDMSELLAHDEKSYSQWILAITTVIE